MKQLLHIVYLQEQYYIIGQHPEKANEMKNILDDLVNHHLSSVLQEGTDVQ